MLPADDLAEEAYAVLRDALRATRKVGLGQLSVRGREQLVSLKPCGRGLILEVLRYADEVTRAQKYFSTIPDQKADPDLLDLATAIIDKKTAPFHPEEFHDRYVDALQRLIEKKKKAKGKRIIEDVEEPAARGSNVIDLMAALKKSVGEGSKSAPARKPARKAAAKSPAKSSAKPRAAAKRKSA